MDLVRHKPRKQHSTSTPAVAGDTDYIRGMDAAAAAAAAPLQVSGDVPPPSHTSVPSVPIHGECFDCARPQSCRAPLSKHKFSELNSAADWVAERYRGLHAVRLCRLETKTTWIVLGCPRKTLCPFRIRCTKPSPSEGYYIVKETHSEQRRSAQYSTTLQGAGLAVLRVQCAAVVLPETIGSTPQV